MLDKQNHGLNYSELMPQWMKSSDSLMNCIAIQYMTLLSNSSQFFYSLMKIMNWFSKNESSEYWAKQMCVRTKGGKIQRLQLCFQKSWIFFSDIRKIHWTKWWWQFFHLKWISLKTNFGFKDLNLIRLWFNWIVCAVFLADSVNIMCGQILQYIKYIIQKL